MTRISVTLNEDQYIFLTITRSVLLILRNVSEKKKCKENPSHSRFNIFNLLLCCLRDTVGEHGKARHATDDVPVRRIPSACWIAKATDTN